MVEVKRDYYDVLGVTRSVTADELKKAYRERAMACHPDHHPDDPTAAERFRELSEAYAVLRDDRARAAYGHAGHGAFAHGRGTTFTDFADMFDDVFGNFARHSRRTDPRRRGADLRATMTITLEEAFLGKTTRLQVPSKVACRTCPGRGNTAPPVTCPTCHGAGTARVQQGFFMVEKFCKTCDATGEVPGAGARCAACGGAGHSQGIKTVEVTVPSGAEDGAQFHFPHQGEPAPGQPGDLYVTIRVEPHLLFRRHGADLYFTMAIPMTTAALGGPIEIPTIDARTMMAVPPGTQPGGKLRLLGKGMPIGPHRGEMVIEIVVTIPRNLTARQQELLREFEQATAPQQA